jgi:hypothetical protein
MFLITEKRRARFESKVDRNGPIPPHRPELGPCHVWTARRDRFGYGRCGFRGGGQLAHRFAFFMAHGRWPDPCALHKCDNPSCVNSAHLFEGTKAENNADMKAKGRQRGPRGARNGTYTQPHRRTRGERNSSAKLTDRDVLEIRADYALGRAEQQELADRFHVHHTVISRIILRKLWAHLPIQESVEP